MLLISNCLLGANCRYNGKTKPCPAVIELVRNMQQGIDYLPICPESQGNLPIPRLAGEIIGGNAQDVLCGRAYVQNAVGDDYTTAFISGTKAVCAQAAANNATVALLKENSPSCGSHFVHAGKFDKTLQAGEGVAACALRQMGIKIFSEDQIPQLLEFLNRQM